MSQESETGRSEYSGTPGRVKDLMNPEWFSISKPRKKLDPYTDALFESSMVKESEEETTENSFVNITVEETTGMIITNDNDMVKNQMPREGQLSLENTPNKSKLPSDSSRSETLVEYTNNNTLSPGQILRGTVGETTVPPPTPNELGTSLVSPTTSTPGATPARKNVGSLVESELQSSDESIISSSISSASKENNEDIETGEITAIRLADSNPANREDDNEKEVEDTQEANDPTWVASQDITCPDIEEIPTSCIAQRTRSRTDELRKINLSQIIDSCNLNSTNVNLDGSYDVINRSLDNTEEDNRWRNGIQWCNGLINLDSSLNKMNRYRNDEKRSEAIELYKKISARVQQENKDARENLSEEVRNVVRPSSNERRVTFVVDEKGYTSALGEVIQALEKLIDMRIDYTPKEQVENILKIILAVCIESNVQMRLAQETLRIMAIFIDELLVNRYKMEALETENDRLREREEILRIQISNLECHNKQIKKLALPGDNPEEEESAKDDKIKKLKIELEEVRAKKSVKDEEYINAWGRKNFYKDTSRDLKKKIKELRDKHYTIERNLNAKIREKELEKKALEERYTDLKEKYLDLGELYQIQNEETKKKQYKT